MTLDHLGPTLGTLMAQWWSKSPAPPGHRGRMEPLAGTASLEILARTANPVKWGPQGSPGCQGSRARRGRRVTQVWGQGDPLDRPALQDRQDPPPRVTS